MNALPSVHGKHGPVILDSGVFDTSFHFCLEYAYFSLRSLSAGVVAVAFDPDDAASEKKRRETQEDTTPDREHHPIHADLAWRRIVSTNARFGPRRLIVPGEPIQRADGYECDYTEKVHRAHCGLADGYERDGLVLRVSCSSGGIRIKHAFAVG